MDRDEPVSPADAVTTAVGAPLAAAPPPNASGRYVILERVGAGGMGEVFAAYDHVLDRKVALKLVHARHLGSGFQDRLLREARAMARLSHPNVVPVYDAGEADGRVYLAMEFVRGQSLEGWLRERRELTAILEVFRAAARGLAAAHAAGLVHRDVKPSNILIGDDGRVRVADFGVAHQLTTDVGLGSTTATVTTAAGSPAYMAPEQLRGEPADARSDQFSLCVALHEAVTGRRPFVATSRDALLAAMDRGFDGRGVPPWLAAVVGCGLAADPGGRFADMAALIAALTPPAPPSRRGRRRAALAAIGLAVAAGIVLARSQPEVGPRCDDIADDLAITWGPARRARLVGALAHGRGSAGGADAERVAALIDEYAAGWTRERERACRSSRIDRTWPAELEQDAASCLDDRRRELDATVAALEPGGDGAVARSTEIVARLPPTLACGDPDFLRSETEPFTRPLIRLPVAALEDRLQRLHLAQQTGRSEEVDRELPALAAAIAALGHRPLEARLAQFEGDLARERRDGTGAIAGHLAAYVAARSARDPVAAAQAASALVWDHGQFSEDAARAADWGQIATAEVTALGEHRVAINVHYALGALATRRGDSAAAIAAYQRAADLAQRQFGADHYFTGQMRSALAQQLGASGRHADAIAPGRAAVAVIARWTGEESRRLVRPLGGLARSESSAGLHREAEATARRAVAIAAPSGDAELTGDALLNLGNVLIAAGRAPEAVAVLEEAAARHAALGRPGIVADTRFALAVATARAALEAADRGRLAAAMAGLERARAALALAHGAQAPQVAAADATIAEVAAHHRRAP